MKTKEKTLTSLIRDNIGQVDIKNAMEHVSRLNKQENTNKWRIDTSDFIYCPDEIDIDVSNPCALSKGNVWVTKTPKLKREKLQKLTKTGYRLTKSGSIIDSFEPDSFKSLVYLGESTKRYGTYYFFNRKQSNVYVYLP
jgi:hypothetical protein